jgi:hypothetical protein
LHLRLLHKGCFTGSRTKAPAEAGDSLLRIRSRVANQSLALLEQSGEFRLLVGDTIGDTLLICRTRKGGSLLLQLAEIVLNDRETCAALSAIVSASVVAIWGLME